MVWRSGGEARAGYAGAISAGFDLVDGMSSHAARTTGNRPIRPASRRPCDAELRALGKGALWAQLRSHAVEYWSPRSRMHIVVSALRR